MGIAGGPRVVWERMGTVCTCRVHETGCEDCRDHLREVRVWGLSRHLRCVGPSVKSGKLGGHL